MNQGLVRYLHTQHADGEQLQWGRVAQMTDPYPFRGRAPLLREEEYENQVGVARYFRCRFFDTTNEEDLKAYADVMDRCAAGWYLLYHQQRFCGENRKFHYLEWFENYMQQAPREQIHVAAG